MKYTLPLLVFIVILGASLRLFMIEAIPPSLNWDEASLGYNAFGIAEEGIDEHGEYLPLARFIAFGDYKPPGYIYVDSLFIKLFGLNTFWIRFPSALSGIGMIVLTYALAKILFGSRKAALFASLAIAISPWSIQLSRAAIEANLAAFFNCLGVYSFILGLKKTKFFFVLSAIFFILSFYTFNANKIIGPVLFVSLCMVFFDQVWKAWKYILLAIFFAFLMLLPSISYLRSPESKLRFQEVSIFNELSIIEKSNQRIALENYSLWSKAFHNRRILFTKEFLKHFSDHFNPRYLFFTGDRNPRLSIQSVGELYLYELPLVLIGLYCLVKRRKKPLILVIIWIVVAIIPAATARETPHALRTASVLPTYQLIIGYGACSLVKYLKQYKRFINLKLFFWMAIFTASIYYYLHYYYLHYSKQWASEWQDGYKEMVQLVDTIEPNYDSVVITKYRGRPYIYFLLYNKIKPSQYLSIRKAYKDAWGVWDVQGIGKYYFGVEYKDKVPGKVLFVGSKNETDPRDKVVGTIYSSSGGEAFVLTQR